MPKLYKLGIGFFVVGVAFIVLAHDVLATGTLAAELSRDVGIALCISVFIGFLIEIGLAKQMFEKGLNAIMEQTVPPEVWNEVRQHVIAQAVYRHQFNITMNIVFQNDEYVSTTTLEYKLQSLRDVLKHRVHHRIDAHRNLNLKNATGCRYRFVKLDGKPIELKPPHVSDDQMSVDFDIPFSKQRKEAKVELQFVEYIDPTDTINWWMNASTNTILVKVVAPQEFTDVVVEAHHPARTLLTGNRANGWIFDGVMLPGQGLEIRVTGPQIAASLPAPPVPAPVA